MNKNSQIYNFRKLVNILILSYFLENEMKIFRLNLYVILYIHHTVASRLSTQLEPGRSVRT